MAATVRGVLNRTGSQDEEGNRNYVVVLRVNVESKTEGPWAVLRASGLPAVGSSYNYEDDVDDEAWLRPNCTVANVLQEGRPTLDYNITLNYSTKPQDEAQNSTCENGDIKNPLLQPNKVRGSFTKYQEQATFDRFGLPIVSSSWELMRGPQNEWDANRPSVTVEQNVASLGLETFAAMIDRVNSVTMWGLPARYVKLDNVSWERKYYGNCFRYYTRVLEFSIRYDGFDRDLLDEGTKCLRGAWMMDPASSDFGQYVLDPTLDRATAHLNPANFIKFKDKNGENARVILNGAGRPYDPGASGTGTGSDTVVGSIHVEKYNEANFFLLGVPATF